MAAQSTMIDGNNMIAEMVGCTILEVLIFGVWRVPGFFLRVRGKTDCKTKNKKLNILAKTQN